MRNIKRIKRWKTRLGVAILSAAALGVATEKSVEAANENGERTSLLAAASRAEASAESEKGNGGFWPRLGSNAVPTFGVDEKADFAGASDAVGKANAATGARNRVESANFVGYSGVSGDHEREGAPGGRTRLVDWTTLGASPSGTNEPLGASPSTAPVETVVSVGEVGGNGKTAQGSGNKENVKTGAAGASGETATRSKTPILRDEPTVSAGGGGSFGGALVSTFGALAVVLGAFLALVAFLKRTAPNGGVSGGALEIVDSLAVGDKARLLTIRWGNKLILAAKTPEKIAPLAEIADVEEASALLAEIERRKGSASRGDVGANAAAIWQRGREAVSLWRTARETKGRR